MAAEKHREADGAKAAATTVEEQDQAVTLKDNAIAADDIVIAKDDVISADNDLSSATRDMRQVQAEITASDNQVASLKLRISQDRYYLAHVH